MTTDNPTDPQHTINSHAADKIVRAADAVRRCDITYRQFDYWCRRGLLPFGSNGSGNVRHMTPADAERLQLVTRAHNLIAELKIATAGPKRLNSAVLLIPRLWHYYEHRERWDRAVYVTAKFMTDQPELCDDIVAIRIPPPPPGELG